MVTNLSIEDNAALYLSIYLSIYLQDFSLSIYLREFYIVPSIYIPTYEAQHVHIYLSIYLSQSYIVPSIYLHTYAPMPVFSNLSSQIIPLSMSVFISIHQTTYLSI